MEEVMAAEYTPMTPEKRANVQGVIDRLTAVGEAIGDWTDKAECRRTGVSYHARFDKRVSVAVSVEWAKLVPECPAMLADACRCLPMPAENCWPLMLSSHGTGSGGSDMIDIEAVKAREAAATPGPWRWGGLDDAYTGVDLRAMVSGIPIVMGFRRLGMRSAQPCFWRRENPKDNPGWSPADYQLARSIAVREVPYRRDVVALDNADARFIAAARQDVADLLAEVERYRELCRRLSPEGICLWCGAIPATDLHSEDCPWAGL
jgi:hypothetical protein